MAQASIAGQSERTRLALRLLRVGISLILLAFASALLNDLSTQLNGVSVIWLPNSLMIGVLICTKRRQWPIFFLLGFSVDLGINFYYGSGVGSTLLFSTFNMLEILIAAHFMHRAAVPEPDLTRSNQLKTFLLYGVLLAPAIASGLASFVIHKDSGQPFLLALRHWFAADFLGIAMVTPLYIFFHQGQRFSLRSRLEAVLLLILLCAITVWCFRYSHTPILWLVLLCLLLCGVRIGFSGAAAALLMVTFIGAYYTIKGFGPLTENSDALPMRILLFQCFVAMCMLALYVTEVARTANRRLQASLATSETRFRSLAETSRDVLVLADLDGVRVYVSPSSVELTGYTPEELVGKTIFEEVHPEDQIDFRTMFTNLVAGESTSPLAYRIRGKDLTYRWIEVNARLSAKGDGDQAQYLVFVKRDIADRKEAEEKLLTAFRVAEKLALVDGLTGLANRRLFDETLAREWQRSMRERTAISLIMIDVDVFKSFNDLYGHLAGDECLRMVAEEVRNAIMRTTDLLARFGGEEFVAVLPNTGSEAAEKVAERARKAVEQRAIPHAGSRHGVVTISVGIATQVPEFESGVNSLIEAADAALYRAKAAGRNRSGL